MRISDWSSDVFSSDLSRRGRRGHAVHGLPRREPPGDPPRGAAGLPAAAAHGSLEGLGHPARGKPRVSDALGDDLAPRRADTPRLPPPPQGLYPRVALRPRFPLPGPQPLRPPADGRTDDAHLPTRVDRKR